ncbi:MAG: hypothetical protein KTR25_15270 [Myxococcales bacterium]|nr:hypothetical protein [Myxococcales bacterium]
MKRPDHEKSLLGHVPPRYARLVVRAFHESLARYAHGQINRLLDSV